jgi:N-hydroxyarylamine O-acetyltransferase
MDSLSDLAAYLARIGVSGVPAPTVESLFTLHRAHVEAIPFENLDILLGRPIRLDLPSLEAKLVASRRGGYCFEQNTLFASALASIGFAVTPLAGRVRLGGRTDGPRTHMLLSVRAGDHDWLADVGFGGGGLLEPISIEPSGESRQGSWRFRVVEEGTEHVLQNGGPTGWRDLYAFTTEPQLPVDFVVANHYTSTHPDSSFTKLLLVQRTSLDVAYMIRGDVLLTMRPGEAPRKKSIADGEELLALLEERFGLAFPSGTSFPQSDVGES